MTVAAVSVTTRSRRLNIAAMATKMCGRCKTEKDVSEFNRRARSRDGLQPFCRDCDRRTSSSNRTPGGRLPKRPEKVMGSAMFLVCGALVDGPKSVGKLRHMLEHEVEWGATKRSAAYAALAKFELEGLLNSIEFDFGKDRIYQLTRKGFIRWAATCRFYQSILDVWGHQVDDRSPDDFPDIQQSARATRPVISNRPATPEEAEKILAVAAPDWRQLYKFSLIVGVRPTDFANARIERIDWKHKTLTLEEISISHRPVDDRTIKLNARAVKHLKATIGVRTEGLIFTQSNGLEWTGQKVSRLFRDYTRKAGLPDKIALSGRGGHIASQWEESGPGRRQQR